MGAKLIHLINDAWLMTEVKRLINGDIHRLCLAVANSQEAEDIKSRVDKIWGKVWDNTPEEIREKCTSKREEHYYRSYTDWVINHFDDSKQCYVMIVREEWFKKESKMPNNYDSFLISHNVHDVFFKSAIVQNCK